MASPASRISEWTERRRPLITLHNRPLPVGHPRRRRQTLYVQTRSGYGGPQCSPRSARGKAGFVSTLRVLVGLSGRSADTPKIIYRRGRKRCAFWATMYAGLLGRSSCSCKSEMCVYGVHGTLRRRDACARVFRVCERTSANLFVMLFAS